MSFSRRREGFVLFIVLVIVATVAVFLFSLFFVSNLNLKKTEDFKDYTIAYHAAVSATKIALKFLEQDRNGFDGEGDDWASPFSYNYRGIFVSLKISDECGKLNVNRLTDPLIYRMGERLMENLEMEDIIPAVKDWIDSDDYPEDGGAESFYYEAFGYKPSNTAMRSIYELLYVKGVDEKTFKKLKNFLTVYGDGKINVNSAPKEVLLSLGDDMNEEAVNSIIQNRPIKDIAVLKTLPGFDEGLYFKIKPRITNRCEFFRIEASASYGDVTVTIEAYSDRSRILEWKVEQ